MNFLDVEIDEALFKKLVIASLVLICVYMAFTMSSLLVFKTYTLGANTSANDETIKTHIDSILVDKKKIEITGWAYDEDEPIQIFNSNFVIKNQETDKMYLMRTSMEKKEELEPLGYANAGMHSQCLRLGLPKGKYQIYVLYKNDGKDILADTLIPFEI